MLIRKIVVAGASNVVVLPAIMLRELGWMRGDFLGIEVVAPGVVTLRRVKTESLSDAQITASRDEPTINHG